MINFVNVSLILETEESTLHFVLVNLCVCERERDRETERQREH